MREWQDISVTANLRLPHAKAIACLGTRLDWTWDEGPVLCINGTGEWTLRYGNDRMGIDPSPPVLSGVVPNEAVPTPGTAFVAVTFSTVLGNASATYSYINSA